MRLVVLTQTLGGAIAGLALWVFSDATAGYSALLGGLCVIVPNAVFAGVFKLLQDNIHWSSPSTLMALEATKFLIAALLFSWVFTSMQWLEPWAFFVGVIGSLFAVIFIAFVRELRVPTHGN